MAETSTMEFDMLRRRADELGFHVQRHRDFDPYRGTGDLYIMEKRRFREEHMPTLRRYQTAEQIWAFLRNGGSHG
jgi:hypothetical protein